MSAELKRCSWCGDDQLYQKYHDVEWGKPVYKDRRLFEMLILEGAQAGLSWITILRKRENYRTAFDQFDVEKVARYGEGKVVSLLADSGIVRNRLKINATIRNAQSFIEIQKERKTFSRYLWDFVEGRPVQNHWVSSSQVPTRTELSDRISQDLQKRGMKFVGSTIIYSYLQAVGVVNDHLVSCHRYAQLALGHEHPLKSPG